MDLSTDKLLADEWMDVWVDDVTATMLVKERRIFTIWKEFNDKQLSGIQYYLDSVASNAVRPPRRISAMIVRRQVIISKSFHV